jgi:hypothetical protein
VFALARDFACVPITADNLISRPSPSRKSEVEVPLYLPYDYLCGSLVHTESRFRRPLGTSIFRTSVLAFQRKPPCPKAKLMSCVEITWEPDGEQIRCFYKNCTRAILTRTASPSNRAGGTSGGRTSPSRDVSPSAC